MKLNKKAGLAGLAALSAGVLATAVAAPAFAAVSSDAPFYVYDPATDLPIAVSHTFAFADSIYVSASATDALADFTCPADSTDSYTFISPVGQENVRSSWIAYAEAGFYTGKKWHQVDVSPTSQTAGSVGTVKNTGGAYSVGLACTQANGVILTKNTADAAGLWFQTMTVTAGTGAFTIAAGASTSTPTPTPTATATPLPGTQTGSLSITSTQEAGADGGVQLIMPSTTSVVLSPAAKENGHAVSTGTLPNIQVKDQNFNSLKGWSLTTSVANFVNAADSTKTIAATNLGFTPVAVSSEPNPISLGTAQVAGSAAFPTAVSFASLADNFTLHNLSETGLTTLNGNLKLVSPAGAPAGTYNSTMTLTLVPNN